jgi:hypothetical protein
VPQHFPARPHLEPEGNGSWRVAEDYLFPVANLWVKIPEGFETDLASVPRLLTVLVQDDELGGAAPLAHDALYQWSGDTGQGLVLRRRQVDALFRLYMRLEGVPAWKRTVAWLAVRFAGWACWHRNGKGKNMILDLVRSVKQAAAGAAVAFVALFPAEAILAEVSTAKAAAIAAVAAGFAAIVGFVGNLAAQWIGKGRKLVGASSADAAGLLVEAQAKIDEALAAL